jgi:hypothetical protein
MDPLKLRARTALAADIAGVNRQRFNEAVAEGFYPCAPRTVRGATRLFDVNDILTLWVYGQLLDQGVTPRHAGAQACGLRDFLSVHPGAERVVFVRISVGTPAWLDGKTFDRAWTHLSGSSIVSATEWHLKFPRERILHELAEWNTVVGPAESDDE